MGGGREGGGGKLILIPVEFPGTEQVYKISGVCVCVCVRVCVCAGSLFLGHATSSSASRDRGIWKVETLAHNL